MKYEKSILIICLLIFLINISTVVANDIENETQISVQQNESILSTNDNNGTFSELQKKINEISDDTITLDKDYTYNDNFITTGIFINKDITINGNGHTLNGQSKSRIFLINFLNQVTLTNIKFINGNTPLYGGAIFNYGNLTVNNCEFTNNYAKTCGGAISSVGYLTCTNSKFNKNTASGDGGGLFTLSIKDIYKELSENTTLDGNIEHLLILIINSTIKYGKDTVTNCIFTNNDAKGRGGGAIYAFTSIDIISTTFTSNKAGENGGAVFANKDVYITNSKFTSNQVSKYGGAVYFKCHEQTGHYENLKWVSEIKYYTGTIQTSSFEKNSASRGGAIYGFKTSSKDKHSLKVVKSTFTVNNAKTGRDIYGVTTTNCIFNYLKLSLKSVKVKKSAKKLVLTAKLTKGKSLIKNKIIIFKFNGKTYKAKSNKKGIAKAIIGKNVLKKLKIGKKIKYQAKYNKLIVKKVAKVIK